MYAKHADNLRNATGIILARDPSFFGAIRLAHPKSGAVPKNLVPFARGP
jgi:hypothetical protein